MRVLAIGLGGAGCRIVDHLYLHDQRSKVGCMSPIAIDTDVNTLIQLQHLPDEVKIHFPPIDPDQHYDARSTLDIQEIMTLIQRSDTVEIDAIMIFSGLGGNLVDAISVLVPELRKSFIEPVFAMVTLPCLGEGKFTSAKASDDIRMVDSIVDAVIIFDNETWYQKSKGIMKSRGELPTSPIRRPGLPGGASGDNPRDIYRYMNERIARQIGLLLRAGEFNEEGLEVSEIVLDAGEILNTLKGNGVVAVGYAIEQLPKGWFDVFDRWRSARFYFEGAEKRAARIVSLAKKAVYEDISVPCDLTSADKALILIAGPSKELSMKGFQTVRKWIDRSIAGLEMRSGDYPVKNTDYVGIIIMLSGLRNIPRINDITRIKDEYERELELEELRRKEERQLMAERLAGEDGGIATEGPYAGNPILDMGKVSPAVAQETQKSIVDAEVILPKDEMIMLPGKKKKTRTTTDQLNDSMMRITGKSRGNDEKKLSLPKRPDKDPLDITRRTDGGVRYSPKESTLQPQGMKITTTGPKNSTLDGSGITVSTLPKAKDGIIDADLISIQPMRKPRPEGIIDAESMKIASSGKKIQEIIRDDDSIFQRMDKGSAKDDIFMKADNTLKSPPRRAKETDPAKRRLKVIDTQEEEPQPGEPDEDPGKDLFWIK